MSRIEESIEVEVPLSTAYNQWTQFAEFPNFMDGVKEVRQLDDTHLHWVVELGGQRHEWDAVVTEQKPEERVAWRNTTGKENAGVVTFHRIDASTTRLTVQMDYLPEGVIEKLGDAVGAPDRRLKGDLARFKGLLESRGHESGAWRGSGRAGANRLEPCGAVAGHLRRPPPRHGSQPPWLVAFADQTGIAGPFAEASRGCFFRSLCG